MTGPEAIAAAERLHRYTITSEGASLGYFRLVEDPDGAWVQWAEVSTLRAALLQSQEQEARVLALCHEWDSRAFYSNSRNNYATELRAALLSPPVAPHQAEDYGAGLAEERRQRAQADREDKER